MSSVSCCSLQVGSSDLRWLLGMLTQPEEGQYFLEDLVTRLPIDLSVAVSIEHHQSPAIVPPRAPQTMVHTFSFCFSPPREINHLSVKISRSFFPSFICSAHHLKVNKLIIYILVKMLFSQKKKNVQRQGRQSGGRLFLIGALISCI